MIAVLAFFCAPLFVGLKGWDLHNDEAIYSYAVDRILETGDWLTPRLIPYDGPFLEKPPLKFWIVAGAIRAGLLPHDAFGFRFIDVLFGAVAFVYVFWLGRSLSGSTCGFVAVLVLFTLNPLLFEHGLRDNNMEAALFLSYCGGIYHFSRWVEGISRRRQPMHAIAVAAYFTLGFMTKFVAALFLPIVCAMAFVWRDGAVLRIRSNWRDWVPPVLLVVAATAPWFVYQTLQGGSAVWQEMFGVHVYERFTGVLDVRHLQPWHHYYSWTWLELTLVGSQWISILGLLLLTSNAWSGRSWLARLLFVWWIVPFAVMSFGTSKVFHYAYPFVPPIALGAGAAAAALVRVIERWIALGTTTAATALVRVVERRLSTKLVEWAQYRTLVRQLLLAGAVFALALGLWTWAVGPIRWEIRGFRLLRNSTEYRPIFVGAVLLCLSGYVRRLSRAVAMVAVAVLLPVLAYPLTVGRLTRVDQPLRAIRDCSVRVREVHHETHVYPAYRQLLNHSYYYYLRPVGPWIEHDGTPKNDELRSRLLVPGQQTLVIVFRSDYETFIEQIARDAEAVRMPAGLALLDDLVLLTPGPFEVCATAAIAAGGRELQERGTQE